MLLRSIVAGSVGLGLLVLAPACSATRPAAPPPQAPPQSGATTPPPQGARASLIGGPAMGAPADGATPPPVSAPPAAAAPEGLPQLPPNAAGAPAAGAAPAPASTGATAADTAATTPAAPAVPLPPLGVNINDELPFLAAAAAKATHHATSDASDGDSKPTSKKPRKHPPGTTGARVSSHGRHRGSSHRPYHPDPGIIVDIASVGAGANQADVQKLARAKGYTPFRHCYEEGLRRNQHLGGKVSVELVIAADGSVSSAKKTASTLSDESVNQCVVREATHLGLSKPDSGTPTVAMVVTLSPGDEPVPVPHAAPHADKLRDALRTKWSGVEVCYKQGLERHRDLGGRIELKFKVSSKGDIL